MMEIDDVYRLVLMTILLGPVVYMSVRWIVSNYRIGIRLHQFVMLMYFIDIVRRHTHPHSWVLNIPMFILWLIDKVWGLWYLYERASVQQTMIGDNYMLVSWRSTVGSSYPCIGEVFDIRCPKYSRCQTDFWERKHPFTAFCCRGSLNDVLLFDADRGHGSKTSKGSVMAPSEMRTFQSFEMNWNRAILVRIYANKSSHTTNMSNRDTRVLDIWGGFPRGPLTRTIQTENVILVGGGSGSGFCLDALAYLTSTDDNGCNHKKRIVKIVITMRDVALLKWLVDIIRRILKGGASSVDLNIILAFTGQPCDLEEFNSDFQCLSIRYGRFDFASHIRDTPDCHVFCEGSPSLQNCVQAAAESCHQPFYGNTF
eukprot:CAMPEP_0203763840 /NCGR_PEP_ID=MMETSP0098-20131031/16951_1 /ASSEMBLY_ACC=CAM_ASM_000208 /TAXON_ID=96639 /ORGANISM=" , Strain NY0313808BC1" /LENGTH=368 /DNA_ID=CAMNT_0050659115 /DNA_START=2498 /DNA_END=3604 /DNA_ORIENTATION=+